MPSGIHQAIFFDVGGTMSFAEPSGDAIWAAALEEHGYHVPPSEVVRSMGVSGHEINRQDIIRALEGAAEGLGEPLPATKEEERAYFRRFDAVVLERLGIPTQEEVLETVARRFREDLVVRVYEDTEVTLRALQGTGYRLGVISNASHDLPDRLEDLGLARYFDTITYSFDVGVEKPHPKIFMEALEQLEVDASRAVHVGDSYEADVLGARGVGITPMLIVRGETLPPSHDCITLRSLQDVVKYL